MSEKIQKEVLALIGKEVKMAEQMPCIIAANIILKKLGINKELPERGIGTEQVEISPSERVGWENKPVFEPLCIGDVIIIRVWSQYHVLIYVGEGYAMHYVRQDDNYGIIRRIPTRRVQNMIIEVWR